MILVGLLMIITNNFINIYIFEFLKEDVARNLWYWGSIFFFALIGRYMDTIDEIRQDVKDIKKKLSND